MKKITKIIFLILIIFNISSCNATFSNSSEKNKTEISVNLKIKLDNILDNFYKKLEKKYLKNSDRIKVLEIINSRINKIKSRKNLKNRTIKILDYLKENINAKIKEYSSKISFCTMDYKPVCGIIKENTIRCITTPCPDNGVYKTFSNACLAKKAGVRIAYYGECKKKENIQKPISPFDYQNMLNLGIDVNWANYDGYIKDYKSIDPVNFKKRGFDHVRIRFKKDTPLEHLKKVVDDSLKAGLIPIIAYGAEELKYNPDEKHIDEVVEKWKKVAEYLKDEPYKLSFDLIIEVGKNINTHPEILSNFQTKAIKAIRETGGKNKDRIIMISGIKRGNPEFLETLKVPDDKFIMLEWHFYAAGPSKTGKYVWTTGTEKEKEVIRKRIALAQKFVKKHNLAQWIGAWMPQNWNHTCDGVYDKRTTVNLWKNKEYDKLKKCPDFYSQKEAINFANFLYNELRKYNIPSAINADGKFYDIKTHTWLEETKAILDSLIKLKK